MKTRAMVMVAVLALAGGACGGDDDGDGTDDTAAADESSGDADTDEDSTGDDADSDDSGGGEWCDKARDLESNTLFDDIDSDDPDSIESAYEEVVDLMEDAADSAPDEIKDDVETVIESTKEIVEALKDVDFDFSAVDQSIFDDPEATAAGDRIDEYGERVCGIESGVDTTITDDTLFVDDSGDDNGAGGDTLRDDTMAQLIGVGLTEDQATCIVDNVTDLEEFARTGASDPTAFLALVETCEIDLTLLTPPTSG